jgi:hypothetical protein
VSSSRPIHLTPKQFGAANALLTLTAMSFLVWVIYFHDRKGSASEAASLPLINAILNGTSAVLISVGLWAIKQRKRTLHMRLMLTAFTVYPLPTRVTYTREVDFDEEGGGLDLQLEPAHLADRGPSRACCGSIPTGSPHPDGSRSTET